MAALRPRPLLALAAALLLALAVNACSWIEWADETPPPLPPPLPPVVTAEAPPAEPAFAPAKPPVPRPSIPAPAAATVAKTPSFDGRHIVKRGETLFSISRLYEVDTFTLASLNALRPPYALEAGQELQVPRRGETPAADTSVEPGPAALAVVPPPRPAAATVAPAVASAPAPAPAPAPVAPTVAPTVSAVPPAEATASATAGFAWPVVGDIVSTFGARPDGSRNDGVDIAAKRGSAVRAARGGRVHYAGNQLKSYGNMVLIRHDDDWWTLYAHADEILVAEGQTVRKGDVIARVGVSGEAGQPLLHFEMRQGKKAVNPLRHLPRRRT